MVTHDERLIRETESQLELVAEIEGVAQSLKDLPREHSLRMQLRGSRLQKLDGRLLSDEVRLPVWPGMPVSGVQVSASSSGRPGQSSLRHLILWWRS